MLEHADPSKTKNLSFGQLKVVFIGDRTNVCSSTMHITTRMGMNFVHIAPKKYQSPAEWIKIAEQNITQAKSGSVKVTDDMNEVADADFVYTDLWWWVDQESEAGERVKAFKPTYQVTPAVLKKPALKLVLCTVCPLRAALKC